MIVRSEMQLVVTAAILIDEFLSLGFVRRMPATPFDEYERALTLASPMKRNRSPKPGSHFHSELRSNMLK